MNQITYRTGRQEEAPQITEAIMLAMNYECCLNLAGPGHTLDDFRQVMLRLTSRQDTQYSYENTIVAVAPDEKLAGAIVGYNGADLLRLRQAFIDEAKQSFGMDYSQMDPETQEGEFYLDSLCVFPSYRGQGIASKLLLMMADKARAMGLPAGLLVDKGNPKAERLYHRLGFEYRDDTTWGGHEMRHLQKP